MSPERWGTVAFLVLAAVAVGAAVLLSEEGACPVTVVPIYPGGVATTVPADAGALTEAVDALGLTPGLRSVEGFLVPPEAWLGGSGLPADPFTFYDDAMTPVPFDRMTPELRRLLGLPETGPVDSPPLLYTRDGAAVVIRPVPDGSLILLVMRCRV